VVPRDGSEGVRVGRDLRRSLWHFIAAVVMPPVVRDMRWARTGRRVGWRTCLEESLAGLVWYVGFLVAVGVLAHVVQGLIE
jgi:hypothetical protein